MTSKPDEYRANAERCRQMAERVFSPHKETWLQLAAEWMTMASIHDRFGTRQTESDTQSGDTPPLKTDLTAAQ